MRIKYRLISKLSIASLLAFAIPAGAVTYPSCISGPTAGQPVSCTMTIHVTTASTPIFARLPQRQYLFIQNTGYSFGGGVPVINQSPVFCSINSNNNANAASDPASNVMVIQAGGVYEPPQIVKPQNAFTVPSGDVSCIAPLGDAWVTAVQE